MEQKTTQPVNNTQKSQPNDKPNDLGAVVVTGHIKIFDPKSQEVFVEKRA